MAVVHAFCTITVGTMGVMGSEITSQLHFDGDPGIAVGVPPGPLNGYGKPGEGDTHSIVPPGICQLVQLGSTKVFEPAGASHRKLSISRVTFSAAAPKVLLKS